MPKPFYVDADFNNVAKPINLAAPTAANDAATKAYVDSAVEGLNWKDSCRVASVATITLSGPGATIDGVAMVANDRFLAKDQAAAAQNGIYIWNGAAVAATRALDMNIAAEVEQAVTSIEEGTSAGATFRQTAVNVTLDTTSLSWTSFGTSAPAASETTAGVAEIATQAEVDAGTDDARMLTALKLKNSKFFTKSFMQNIGDASATSFNIDHNFNTRDVIVEIYRNSGSFDTVLADVSRPSVNRVTVSTGTFVPGANAFRVVVQGIDTDA
jgi:hypothetical protein